ncbi:hypothetical protein ACFSTD_08560 [Novosphingobium colocasiae]|uniref:hypothetical protein n=1 Tax=Novosphingobium colocasiae TaxID=1256513 RepID=UPI0016793F42|nr:hypothetical protein [Novosphingobium colocasiae]
MNMIEDLSRHLESLDRLGASIAAAHLQAAIDAVRREFRLEGDTSTADQHLRDALH